MARISDSDTRSAARRQRAARQAGVLLAVLVGASALAVAQQQLSKQYVYVGGRMVAVEIPAGSGGGSTVNIGVTAIGASGETIVLAGGESQQFLAEVTGASNTDVTWTITGAGCLDAGCTTTSGSNPVTYFSPDPVAAPSTVTIRATSDEDPTRFGELTIQLEPFVVEITPPGVSLSSGESYTLQLTAQGGSFTTALWGVVSGPGSFPQPSVGPPGDSLFVAPAEVCLSEITTVKVTLDSDTSKTDTESINLVPPAGGCPGNPPPGGPAELALTALSAVPDDILRKGVTNLGVSYTVQASGSASGVLLELYLSPFSTSATGDLIATVPLGTIADASVSGDLLVTVPADATEGSARSLVGRVFYPGEVEDADNLNSVGPLQVLTPLPGTGGPLPDLVPASFVVTPSITTSETPLIFSAVGNLGGLLNESPELMKWRLQVEATPLQSHESTSIAFMEGPTANQPFPRVWDQASIGPISTPSTYVVRTNVNTGVGTDHVTESNETNNEETQNLEVTLPTDPDLEIGNLTLSSPSGDAGASVTVTAVIDNTGSGTVATTFRAGLYLSDDATITTGDQLLGQCDSLAVPAPGGSVNCIGNNVTIPATATPGNRFLGALADDTGGGFGLVPETLETNNGASSPFMINGPPQVSSLTPAAGAGSTVTFVASFSDANQATDIASAFVLVNSSLAEANGCKVGYNAATGQLELYDDPGATPIGGLSPGSGLSAENSQCILHAPAMSEGPSISGNVLMITVPVEFKSSFLGGKSVYLKVDDLQASSTGWVQSGSWTVTSSGGPPPSTGPALDFVVTTIGTDQWSTIQLANNYTSLVAACTPAYSASTPPLVVRMQNAAGASFDARLARTDGQSSDVTGVTVHCLAVEEGVYTQAGDGVAMEAVRYTSTVTDHNGSWVGQLQPYSNSYTNPVVLGQVLTANDANFSTFWARGVSAVDPPSASTLYVGKTVSEDPTTTRVNEIVGYVVIESGSGNVGTIEYLAGLGADTVAGYEDLPPYTYSIAGPVGSQSAITSMAGMDGVNGGWPVLYGQDPVSATQLKLAIDEDQLADSERKHTTEQVAYLVLKATATCNYSLNPVSQTADSAQQSYSVSVIADPGCTWTASTPDPWITIDSGSSGSGNSTVLYTIATSNLAVSRQGSITVASEQLLVTQGANQPPSFPALPSNQTHTEGDAVNFSIVATDPEIDSLSYAVAAGSLPPGVNLSMVGAVTGTIALGGESGSPYSATISASDGINGPVNAAAFTWTVNPAGNPAPAIAIGSPADGSTHTAANIPLTYSVTDGDLVDCELQVNGGPAITYAAPCVDTVLSYVHLDDTDKILAYDFAEGAIATAYDREQTENNDGVITGATSATSAYHGQALHFDGVDDRILPAAPNPGDLHAAFTAKTVEAWFKADNTSNRQTIFEEGGSAAGIYVGIYNNQIRFSMQEADGGPETLTEPFTDTTSWHHLAAVFDAGTMTLYLDGASVATQPATFSSVAFHGGGPGVGASGGKDADDNVSGTQYFAGDLDEIAVYNDALTSTEVADHAANEYLSGTGNTIAITANDSVQSSSLTSTFTVNVGAAPSVVGLLELEAESGTLVAGSTHDWQFQANINDYSGTGFLRAEPDSGTNQNTGYVGVSPEVQFTVDFPTSGTYYIWVRGYGTASSDDSVHVGLDGAAVATADRLSAFDRGAGGWVWSSFAMSSEGRTTIDVLTAGTHTVNVWMREDGFRFDKIGIADDAALHPTWAESNGHFGMEVEFAEVVSSSPDSWVFRTDVTGYSGYGYVKAEPDDGTTMFAGGPPRLRFTVEFQTSGTYYIWLLGNALTSGNSVWISDNAANWKNVEWNNNPGWSWTNDLDDGTSPPPRATLFISSGTQTLDISMREDGLQFDRIVINDDPNFVP